MNNSNKINLHSQMKNFIALNVKSDELEDLGLEETQECKEIENEMSKVQNEIRSAISKEYSTNDKVEIGLFFSNLWKLVEQNSELAS